MLQLKIELDISAQKLLHNFQLHNEGLENQLKKGLEEAIEELKKDDAISAMIKEEVINSVRRTIAQTANSYEIKNLISSVLNESIGKKIQSYANDISEKIIKELKDQ